MYDIHAAKGYIFDCDGTLLDTLDAWAEAERDLFAQAGDMTQEEEDEIHSAPIEKAAEILHERYGVGKSAAAVLAHLDGYLLPYYAEKAQVLDGVVPFVQLVHEQGKPCVVLSSSPRRYLEAGLRHAGILDCFLELITTDETGCSKQNFAIYERALSILGTDAADTCGIDDAPYAIAVMHEFGLRTVCVGERTSEFADLNVASLNPYTRCSERG